MNYFITFLSPLFNPSSLLDNSEASKEVVNKLFNYKFQMQRKTEHIAS